MGEQRGTKARKQFSQDFNKLGEPINEGYDEAFSKIKNIIQRKPPTQTYVDNSPQPDVISPKLNDAERDARKNDLLNLRYNKFDKEIEDLQNMQAFMQPGTPEYIDLQRKIDLSKKLRNEE